MGKTCLIPNCPTRVSRNNRISMFMIPRDPTTRSKWFHFMFKNGIDPTTYTQGRVDSLCRLHFADDAFLSSGGRISLRPGSVPTITPDMMDVDSSFNDSENIKDQEMASDISFELQNSLRLNLDFLTSKHPKWDYKKIGENYYLYKLMGDPLIVEAAVKFSGSQVELQYDGVYLTQEYVEKVLGEVFPLTAESLPDLLKYFDLINLQEFRRQRPDIDFNFRTNVKNKLPAHKTCRICFQEAGKDVNEESRRAFEDITNRPLAEDDWLPKQMCSNCKKMLENVSDFKISLNSNEDLLINHANEYLEELKVMEEPDSKQIFKPKVAVEVEVVGEVLQDVKQEFVEIEYLEEELVYDGDDFDQLLSVKVQDEDTVSLPEQVEVRPPEKKKKRTVRNWAEEEGYSITTRIEEGKKRKAYACLKCNRTFKLKKFLDAHFRTSVHSGSKFSETCGSCGAQLGDKQALQRHMRMVHDCEKRPCPTCGKEFNEFHLRSHMKTHRLGRLACDFCSRTFSKRFKLTDHIREQHTNEAFICHSCSQGFQSKTLLLRHLKSAHSSSFLCSQCGRSFISSQGLASHSQSCSKETPESAGRSQKMGFFGCRFCSKKFAVRKLATEHEARHQKNELAFRCDECSVNFARKDALKVHQISVHTRGFRFSCSFCNRGFVSQSAAKVHERHHTRDRPFKCGNCDAQYAKSSHLKEHIDSKHRNKRYRCKFCLARGTVRDVRKFLSLVHHMKGKHPREFEQYGGNGSEMVVVDQALDEKVEADVMSSIEGKELVEIGNLDNLDLETA